MKLINLMAGRPDWAWDLSYIMALDPSSPVYWPELFMLDLCDKPGYSTQLSVLGSFTAHFVSQAQLLYRRMWQVSQHPVLTFCNSFNLHTSSAEFLMFTSSDQSSQGKFTAVCFLQWVVLLMLFQMWAGCFDHASDWQNKTSCWCSGEQRGCTDLLFHEGASRLLADSSTDRSSPAPHGKRHVTPSLPQQGGSAECKQHRLPNVMVCIKGY